MAAFEVLVLYEGQAFKLPYFVFPIKRPNIVERLEVVLVIIYDSEFVGVRVVRVEDWLASGELSVAGVESHDVLDHILHLALAVDVDGQTLRSGEQKDLDLNCLGISF